MKKSISAINHNGHIDSVISTISIIYGNTITHQTTHLPNYILTTPPVTNSGSHYLIHSLTHWTIHSLTLSHPLIYPETSSLLTLLAQSLHHCSNNLVIPNHFPTQLLLHLLLRSLNHSFSDPLDDASGNPPTYSPIHSSTQPRSSSLTQLHTLSLNGHSCLVRVSSVCIFSRNVVHSVLLACFVKFLSFHNVFLQDWRLSHSTH